jgi:hypothetical protein
MFISKNKIRNLSIALVGFGNVMTIANPAQAALFGSNNTPGYFDASSGSRIITFSADETISDLNVLVDFVKADGEAFDPPYPTGTPYFSEIVFRLFAPGGLISTDLISSGSFNSGVAPEFDGKIIFDQQATEVVNVDPGRPQAGIFRPVGNLSVFNGLSSLGDWTLRIEDTTGNDALRFRGFNIGINGPATVDAVPTPALLPALIGMGAAAYRRRKGNATARV